MRRARLAHMLDERLLGHLEACLYSDHGGNLLTPHGVQRPITIASLTPSSSRIVDSTSSGDTFDPAILIAGRSASGEVQKAIVVEPSKVTGWIPSICSERFEPRVCRTHP